MNLQDLLGALALADATCAVDTAWDAVYTDLSGRLSDDEKKELPASETLRESMHANVHAVINGVIAAGLSALGGGGLPGFGGLSTPEPPKPTLPTVDDDFRPGQYL